MLTKLFARIGNVFHAPEDDVAGGGSSGEYKSSPGEEVVLTDQEAKAAASSESVFEKALGKLSSVDGESADDDDEPEPKEGDPKEGSGAGSSSDDKKEDGEPDEDDDEDGEEGDEGEGDEPESDVAKPEKVDAEVVDTTLDPTDFDPDTVAPPSIEDSNRSVEEYIAEVDDIDAAVDARVNPKIASLQQKWIGCKRELKALEDSLVDPDLGERPMKLSEHRRVRELEAEIAKCESDAAKLDTGREQVRFIVHAERIIERNSAVDKRLTHKAIAPIYKKAVYAGIQFESLNHAYHYCKGVAESSGQTFKKAAPQVDQSKASEAAMEKSIKRKELGRMSAGSKSVSLGKSARSSEAMPKSVRSLMKQVFDEETA